MANHYSATLLRTLRNRIPIDAVIVDMLRLDIRPDKTLLRSRCPPVRSLSYGDKPENQPGAMF